jgi:hypothetical protein
MTLWLDLQSVIFSKKSVFCASKISSPSVLSHDTKTSKVSEKDNPHDFYPKNFNHSFLPKPDFEGYRNNAKEEFEENQNYVGDEEFHQEPDLHFCWWTHDAMWLNLKLI